MKNFKLTIAYDGTRYNGWQKQGNTSNTIQGKIEGVLERMLGQSVEIHGSGRTDAGVHAAGQVASFKAETEKTPLEIMGELNAYLPMDIAVTAAEYAPERFHARLNAREKVYVYRIWTKPYPNVFERKYMYSLGIQPDIGAMERAGGAMTGTADFIGYSSLKKTKKSTVRTVRSIDISEAGGEIRMTFIGNGFLYNMVRIMAGTIVEVGLGRRDIESVRLPFATGSRADAGETLPACGLTLMKVIY